MKRFCTLCLFCLVCSSSWAIYKNVASQKVDVYAYDTSAGAPKKYDAANITAWIITDSVTSRSIIDTNPTEKGSGVYTFDLSTTETNSNKILIVPVSATANVVLEPVSIYTREVMRGTDSAALATSVATIDDYVDDLETRLTAARAGYLDKLNVTGTLANSDAAATYKATGFSTHSAADVWTVADRELTTITKTVNSNLQKVLGIAVSSSATAPPTSATIAEANWGYSGTRALTTPSDYMADLSGLVSALATIDDFVDDLETRLTAARAGYLDKLNISGNVAGATPLAAVQDNLTTLTGADGVILATSQPNYAPYTGTPPTAATIASAVMADAATSSALATAQADLDDSNQYKATGFSTHSAADVWSVATRALTDKAGFSLSVTPPTAAQIKTEIEQAGSTLALIKAVTDLLPDAGALSSLSTANAVTTIDGIVDAILLHASTIGTTLSAIQTHGDSTWQTAVGFPTVAELNARTRDSEDYATSATEGLTPTSFTLIAKASDLAARTLVAEDYATSATVGGATAADLVTALDTSSTQLAAIAANLNNPTQYQASVAGLATTENQTSILSALTQMKGTGFTSATHSLVAIRARGDSSWVSALGAGAITTTYTITNSATSLPISDVTVRVATDSAGANIVASAVTNAFGKVVFYLDEGTYYFFRKKSGISFADPDTVEVSE